jgi:putative transposase
MQGYRRERHGVSRLTVHLVCGTKYRRKVVHDAALAWLKDDASRVFHKMGRELMACDGEADHLHMLVEYPSK